MAPVIGPTQSRETALLPEGHQSPHDRLGIRTEITGLGSSAKAGKALTAAERSIGQNIHALPPGRVHNALVRAADWLKIQVRFAAGTPLRTPDGAKPIEDFRPGDLVLSRDEHDPAGLVGPKQVEEVFVREGLVWHLHVGGLVIRTTAEHPFYAHGKGWVACHELTIGDWLLTEDGRWQAVEDLLDTGCWETVYNLRVADYHTYFVGTNEWGFALWAHNAYCQRSPEIDALSLSWN